MVLIEVQIGTYFGEDDIIRYEDIYKEKTVIKRGVNQMNKKLNLIELNEINFDLVKNMLMTIRNNLQDLNVYFNLASLKHMVKTNMSL